jgi:dihydrofolate reductase
MGKIIIATDDDWGFGNSSNQNGLPWESIPEDFKHFQEITKECVEVVMGKNTWEVIFKLLGKPLPKRISNILSTTMKEPPHPEVKLFSSVSEILEHLKGKEYGVIGGIKTCEAFIPHVDEVILTRVYGTFPADCWFRPTMLNDFYEDAYKRKILREASEKLPAAIVHYYKRAA